MAGIWTVKKQNFQKENALPVRQNQKKNEEQNASDLFINILAVPNRTEYEFRMYTRLAVWCVVLTAQHTQALKMNKKKTAHTSDYTRRNVSKNMLI